MNPDTREGLMRAAQACADAEIRGAERSLQIYADSETATDEGAERWLERAEFACDVVADMRFWEDRVLSSAALTARDVCREESHAALMRRIGRAA